VHERLIEPAERWLFERAWLALGLAFLLRLALRLTLWGGLPAAWHGLGGSYLDAPLCWLLLAAALQLLVATLVPRAFAAAAGLVAGGLCYAVALELLARFGWPLPWRTGPFPLGWLAGAGGLLLAALGVHTWRRSVWLGQLRGHGVDWTRLWAQDKPYAARRLALRSLRYMGDSVSQ
jgi:hypothetical protein